MRKDIEIHINTGDITLPSQNRVTLRGFQWVERPADMLDENIYGEVTIPAYNSEDSVKKKGVYLEIPYTPIRKPFMLRFRRTFENGDYISIINPTNGNEWFPVSVAMYGDGRLRSVYASELMAVSETKFYLAFDKGRVYLYSGNETDLNIINANTQNRNMMLKCVPSNNYRYPLTGVGLIRWAHSNIDVSTLATILKQEFASDGTPVESAQYDFEARKLYLKLNTASVDGEV